MSVLNVLQLSSPSGNVLDSNASTLLDSNGAYLIIVPSATISGSEIVGAVKTSYKSDPYGFNLGWGTISASVRTPENYDLNTASILTFTRYLYPFGTFYPSEISDNLRGLTTITAVNAIGALDGEFLGGMYSGYSALTLIKDILGDLVGTVTCDTRCATKFASATISGYIGITTRLNALRQVMQSLGFGLRVTKKNDVQVYYHSTAFYTGTPLYVEDDYETKHGDYYSSVLIKRIAYSKPTSAALESVGKITLKAGVSQRIESSSPCYGWSVSGATISESGAGYCILSSATAGEYEVKAKKYVESSTSKTLTNSFSGKSEKQATMTLYLKSSITDTIFENSVKGYYFGSSGRPYSFSGGCYSRTTRTDPESQEPFNDILETAPVRVTGIMVCDLTEVTNEYYNVVEYYRKISGTEVVNYG